MESIKSGFKSLFGLVVSYRMQYHANLRKVFQPMVLRYQLISNQILLLQNTKSSSGKTHTTAGEESTSPAKKRRKQDEHTVNLCPILSPINKVIINNPTYPCCTIYIRGYIEIYQPIL